MLLMCPNDFPFNVGKICRQLSVGCIRSAKQLHYMTCLEIRHWKNSINFFSKQISGLIWSFSTLKNESITKWCANFSKLICILNWTTMRLKHLWSRIQMHFTWYFQLLPYIKDWKLIFLSEDLMSKFSEFILKYKSLKDSSAT